MLNHTKEWTMTKIQGGVTGQIVGLGWLLRLTNKSTWVRFFDSSQTQLNSSQLESFSNQIYFGILNQNPSILGWVDEVSLKILHKLSIHITKCTDKSNLIKIDFITNSSSSWHSVEIWIFVAFHMLNWPSLCL